ncbi:MAG: TatD family hydrolase [Gammaproteobacteria bacterium]|nr:TatD family hydrolase [Gammaproteobacteria bacterium]
MSLEIGVEIWDSHCHMDDDLFAGDRAAVIGRARTAGVTTQVVPAVSAATWPRLKAVCAAFDGLLPAYGLHPMYLAHHRDEHLTELARWLEAESPVAVGECGLDYYVEGLDRDRQLDIFEAHIRLARDYDLPLIVHGRKALDDVLKCVRRHPGVRGVAHSFSGSEQQARQLLDNGFLLGIGGPLTYPRARRLRRVVAAVPLEGLVLETDAPDQPVAGHQGVRNEPARVTDVLAAMAEVRGMAVAEVARATTANARRLFSPRA